MLKNLAQEVLKKLQRKKPKLCNIKKRWATAHCHWALFTASKDSQMIILVSHHFMQVTKLAIHFESTF